MTSQTLTITVPAGDWMTSNHRLHRMDEAGRTKRVRSATAAHAAHLAPMPAANVRVAVGYPTARKADPPNAWPTAKACLDGLVDAGILPDDNSSVVPATTFVRADGKTARGTYELTITLTSLEVAA